MARDEAHPNPQRRSDPTRAAILTAARNRFGADGYERATIRAIAAEAGIDPAMVMRYYGNKENLFATAAEIDLRFPDLAEVPRDELGATLVRIFLDRWEANDSLPMILRSAMTKEAAAQKVQLIYRDQVAVALWAVTTSAEVVERAGLVASQVIGLAICRYVLKLAPLDTLTDDEMVARFGPTLQRYLTEPFTPTRLRKLTSKKAR
ncbi:MAG: TetR family transcriptional regulator [Jatrophihabitans sp.]